MRTSNVSLQTEMDACLFSMFGRTQVPAPQKADPS